MSTPTILLACTGRWISSARLGLAFMEAGCHVEAVCPADHPLAKTRAGRKTYRYQPLAPLQSFRMAIDQARPDLIVPCDDVATSLLHQLHRTARQAGDAMVVDLVERSLGDPASFDITASRSRFMAFAAQLGIRTPSTATVDTPEALGRWLDANGLPALLKADGTSGASGVRVVDTQSDAAAMWKALQAPPTAARAAKRAIVNRDWHDVRRWLRRTHSVVSVQQFVPGTDANAAIACWQGQIVAMTTVVVLQAWYERGPATVVRVVNNPQIVRAVTCIVRRLRLTGLYGFDFLIDNDNGDPCLIEMNPRATQTSHLRLGPDHDLCGALVASLTGTRNRPAGRPAEHDVIALFPQEWLRDPASPHLRHAFHDVPWGQAELIRFSVKKDFRFAAWTAIGPTFKRTVRNFRWRHA